MCYTTNNLVRLTTEVTYNESLPYGTNSYRTDCNNIQVNNRLLSVGSQNSFPNESEKN